MFKATNWPWPLEKQVKFWEACGFRRDSEQFWIYPDGYVRLELPPLDMNNLKEWGLPRVMAWDLGRAGSTKLYECGVRDRKIFNYHAPTPEQAIAEALWEALIGKGEP